MDADLDPAPAPPLPHGARTRRAAQLHYNMQTPNPQCNAFRMCPAVRNYDIIEHAFGAAAPARLFSAAAGALFHGTKPTVHRRACIPRTVRGPLRRRAGGGENGGSKATAAWPRSAFFPSVSPFPPLSLPPLFNPHHGPCDRCCSGSQSLPQDVRDPPPPLREGAPRPGAQARWRVRPPLQARGEPSLPLPVLASPRRFLYPPVVTCNAAAWCYAAVLSKCRETERGETAASAKDFSGHTCSRVSLPLHVFFSLLFLALCSLSLPPFPARAGLTPLLSRPPSFRRQVWRVKLILAKIRKAARELLTLEEKVRPVPVPVLLGRRPLRVRRGGRRVVVRLSACPVEAEGRSGARRRRTLAPIFFLFRSCSLLFAPPPHHPRTPSVCLRVTPSSAVWCASVCSTRTA